MSIVSKKPKKTTEVEEAIEFLRNVSNDDKEAIKLKMNVTYEYRQSLGVDVLKHFPRFLDNSWLVNLFT